MTPPDIFDRNARRLRRARASGDGFFIETMAEDLLERLDGVSRSFTSALIQGSVPRLICGLKARAIAYQVVDVAPRLGGEQIGEEDDRLFEDGRFDLVLSCGVLDTVSDLPGALLLLRRALRPDGLFLGALVASPSLTTLRDVVAQADARCGIAAARLHPQVEVRAVGDLLVRAGFALPVADLDTLDLSYRDLESLVRDLRAAAATNVMPGRSAITRAWLAEANRAFGSRVGKDGRVHETVSYITLTGWAPDSTQPQPARRGSGRASLAALLDRST